MSNAAREGLLALFCLCGLAAMITGAVIAWGWAGMLIVVGALFFLIFLAMVT